MHEGKKVHDVSLLNLFSTFFKEKSHSKFQFHPLWGLEWEGGPNKFA